MIDSSPPPPAGPCACPLRPILLEALLVLLAGAACAFLANQISPRGLKLARDYSPAAHTLPAPPGHASPAVPSLAARLGEKGLHLIDRAEVTRLFHDPRARQNAILFIDARDESDYQRGHIPGAYEFFPYYPEKYLAAILPLCQVADQIIVYCTGGECADSQSAAGILLGLGIPPAKLLIYGDGITDWTTHALPVEIGPRDSGDIHPGAP